MTESVKDRGMTQKNRSVPTDTMVAHVVYADLARAIAWLEQVLGFRGGLKADGHTIDLRGLRASSPI